MLGWRVLVVWECITRSAEASDLCCDVLRWINSTENYGEIGDPAH